MFLKCLVFLVELLIEGKKYGISISQPGMRLTRDHWDDSALLFSSPHTSLCSVLPLPLLYASFTPSAPLYCCWPICLPALSPNTHKTPPNLILPSFFIKSFIPRSKLIKSVANSKLSFLLPLFCLMSMRQQPANCQEAHMLWDLDNQLYFLGNVILCEAKLTRIFKSKVTSGTLAQR